MAVLVVVALLGAASRDDADDEGIFGRRLSKAAHPTSSLLSKQQGNRLVFKGRSASTQDGGSPATAASQSGTKKLSNVDDSSQATGAAQAGTKKIFNADGTAKDIVRWRESMRQDRTQGSKLFRLAPDVYKTITNPMVSDENVQAMLRTRRSRRSRRKLNALQLGASCTGTGSSITESIFATPAGETVKLSHMCSPPRACMDRPVLRRGAAMRV